MVAVDVAVVAIDRRALLLALPDTAGGDAFIFASRARLRVRVASRAGRVLRLRARLIISRRV